VKTDDNIGEVASPRKFLTPVLHRVPGGLLDMRAGPRERIDRERGRGRQRGRQGRGCEPPKVVAYPKVVLCINVVVYSKAGVHLKVVAYPTYNVVMGPTSKVDAFPTSKFFQGLATRRGCEPPKVVEYPKVGVYPKVVAYLKVVMYPKVVVSSRGVGGSGLLKPVGVALKVNKLTFTIRVSDFSWNPGSQGALCCVSHSCCVSQSCCVPSSKVVLVPTSKLVVCPTSQVVVYLSL